MHSRQLSAKAANCNYARPLHGIKEKRIIDKSRKIYRNTSMA